MWNFNLDFNNNNDWINTVSCCGCVSDFFCVSDTISWHTNPHVVFSRHGASMVDSYLYSHYAVDVYDILTSCDECWFHSFEWHEYLIEFW